MSNICAGIGLGQIKILDENIIKRRENHKFYKDIFDKIAEVELLEVLNNDCFSNYWLNTILIKSNKYKENLRLAFEKNNIESRPLWKPMHLQPIFKQYPYYGNRVAEDLFERGLCLPSSSNLINEDKDRIKEVLTNFFK